MSTVPEAHTIGYIANVLGRDRTVLGKVLAGVEADKVQGERSLYLLKTVVDALVDGAKSQVKIDKDKAEGRVKDIKGDLMEIQLKEKQGQLVSIEEVQGVWSVVLSSLRSRILAIPTRLAARLAGTQDAKKVKSILDKSVESALTDVSTLDVANITEKAISGLWGGPHADGRPRLRGAARLPVGPLTSPCASCYSIKVPRPSESRGGAVLFGMRSATTDRRSSRNRRASRLCQ